MEDSNPWKHGLDFIAYNHRYQRHTVNKTRKSINQRCATYNKTGFSGSVTISVIDDKIVRSKNHTVADTERIDKTHPIWQDADTIRNKFLHRINLRVETEDIPIQTIYDQENKNIGLQHNLNNQDIAKVVDAFQEIKLCFKKRHAKLCIEKLPKSLAEITLGSKEMTTFQGQQFLIHKSPGNEMLVYASLEGLQMLAKSQCWHGDGTFYREAKYYYQLYIIQAWYEGRMLR